MWIIQRKSDKAFVAKVGHTSGFTFNLAFARHFHYKKEAVANCDIHLLEVVKAPKKSI